MKNEIISLLNQAKQEKWPYPKTYKLLKEQGVIYYSVSWNDGYAATYNLKNGTSFEEKLLDFKSPKKSNLVSIEDAQQVLKDHQNGKTNFYEWLEQMSSFGITNYLISMVNNTATYYSENKEHFFIENIPVV